MDKVSLRKKFKNFDKSLYSELFVKKLSDLDVYKKSKNIMLFYPLKNEINFLEILQDNSKNFYLPKIDGDNLLCCKYSDGDELSCSCFNTMEPLTDACDKATLDLVIVLALACDKNNYRLGYGGGFYDRFLKDFCGTKISFVPKELFLDTIYPDKNDVKLDIVITN